MTAKTELILGFSDGAQWDAWLARHHDRSDLFATERV